MRRSISLLALLLAATAQAQGPRLAPAPFSELRWRNIGPAVFGGRFTDIVVARTRGTPDQIYIAASTGGVFKSVNGGASWVPVFDSVNTLMSMGDLAIAPSNQNVIWVGTGESAKRKGRLLVLQTELDAFGAVDLGSGERRVQLVPPRSSVGRH